MQNISFHFAVCDTAHKKPIDHDEDKGNMTYAEKARARLEAIANASTTSEGVTRLPWTREHHAALDHIKSWMNDAGLEVSLDAAGTLVGSSPNRQNKPVLLIGSHQDSVPSGGRFDGIMGIAIGCLVAEALRDRFAELPFALRVLAFADEEGVRFPTALIGPRALAGTLKPDVLEMADKDGVTMKTAMEGFGLEPQQALHLACQPEKVIGYFEAHIEQGPILEAHGLPVAAVDAICGISRFDVVVRGVTGHAGTVPMANRRDALVAAGRIIALISQEASAQEASAQEASAQEASAAALCATVGTISVKPGAVNTIPAEARFTLEIRSARDTAREAFEAHILKQMHQSSAANGCTLSVKRTYDQRATACDPALTAVLGSAIRDRGVRLLKIPSGATHDASAMADLCPVSMLFVRCRGGISHRPDEYACAQDIAVAVRVLVRTIVTLANDV
jgi:allantoate deiminase